MSDHQRPTPEKAMNYDELSDDDLNRLTAEREGWHGIETRGVSLLGYPPSVQTEAPMYIEHLQHYCTDANAALALLDGLKAKGCEATKTRNGWNVELSGFYGRMGKVSAEAPTFQRAAVIAYLKATEQ